MTNFEKWKNKIAEAKDGNEFLKTIDEMDKAHNIMCFTNKIKCEEYVGCRECEARWLDMEEKND